MKNICYTLVAFTILVLSACNGNHPGTGKEPAPKIPVTVTGIRERIMIDYLELAATSRFLNKSVISANTSGYIVKVDHNPGETIKKGQELFIIQTKEAAALSGDSAGHREFSGLIPIKASIEGMIITIDHPAGDFVTEGEPLGSISVPASLVFILEAPYETGELIRMNSMCEIRLPDGDSIKARITSRLPSMSEKPQTQQYIVVPLTQHDLPEGLIARIRIEKKLPQKVAALPETCILTDELMKNFWVMKLINDSTAVRTEISVGTKNGNDIEITSPVFLDDDLFLASGNYGVGDTVNVNIIAKVE